MGLTGILYVCTGERFLGNGKPSEPLLYLTRNTGKRKHEMLLVILPLLLQPPPQTGLVNQHDFYFKKSTSTPTTNTLFPELVVVC